jgi:hypothetical protein
MAEPKVKIKAKAEVPAKHAFGKRRASADPVVGQDGGESEDLRAESGDRGDSDNPQGHRLGDGLGLHIILIGGNRRKRLK